LSRKPLPKRKNMWNFLKCAYMVMTYLFVSYNKGDWGRSL
ncbi:EDDM13 isoform 2, partial [Pongo abelii]